MPHAVAVFIATVAVVVERVGQAAAMQPLLLLLLLMLAAVLGPVAAVATNLKVTPANGTERAQYTISAQCVCIYKYIYSRLRYEQIKRD